MSLTTVAGPVVPDARLAALPPSHPERFERSDFVAAGLVSLITLGVYIATLAPNVTLEDSGELITAAAKFGVPHPPGYPLWTMSGFLLSHLLPFGNLAWRVNLLSALFGAAANALLTLLVCHSGRWLVQRWTDAPVQPVGRRFCFYAGLFAGLTLGFSNVMWSQAVISAVHGTLIALFVNLVVLLFYLWMIEPEKTHRLILTVFVFALGLTNHHTLIQMIPAILLATLLLRAGKFWSVMIAINLFSLSILVYLSWLSNDAELQQISYRMALIIFGMTALVSFFYVKEFRLRWFLTGAAVAAAFFAYGHYWMGPSELHTERILNPGSSFWLWGSLATPGWLQMSTPYGFGLLGLAAVALGFLFTSKLDKRLVIGAFAAGWIGLMPYSYEKFASGTHPPMNWGIASERAGFYYAVSRQQYPASLPNLIKSKIGKLIGVTPWTEKNDIALDRPDYGHHLWLNFYYYIDNLQQNFTAPLIFLTLVALLYLRRCDLLQIKWFIFLVTAFFFLGFMLDLITPAESFDFERNLQYRVFHLQSHCIFVLLMGYGALAAMLYLHELMPEVNARAGALGLGMPGFYLALLPFWNNFDGCNQADHWFGYHYGTDMMRPMEKNAVYFGGSDPGRFVPTYMAFVESQQDNRWKRDPDFDRRDITVITQNALCENFYCQYIRDQYDPRFRPSEYTSFEKWLGRDRAYPREPVTCISNEELAACWSEYESLPQVAARTKNGGQVLRAGTNDVFEINAIVARKIFDKNKKDHVFYLEQSVPLDWTYPYLIPSGLIFKINPEPLDVLPDAVIEEDRKFWDAYSARLLQDPKFRLDDDATLAFSKLAFWHADLYRYRKLEKEQEYWLKMALRLCPQLQDAVNNLSRLYAKQKRFDEAISLIKQAQVDDPRNEIYFPLLEAIDGAKKLEARETELRAELKQSPNDAQLNLQLARVLEDEGKMAELNDRMRFTAGLTNWSHDAMAEIVQYYVEKVHNPDAAIAFLEARAKIDPKASELIYSLAALHATLNHKDDAFKYLAQAASVGGTNVLISAEVDPRFAGLHDDPRFQDMLRASATNAPPATNVPAANKPGTVLPKPAQK
jgi:tetratricopeptide (TPR) repeat protein